MRVTDLVRFRAVLDSRRAAITGSVSFFVVIAIYLRTIMPGPAFMDTGEFQTVTYVLGVAHPTGYPLYTIVGKAFGMLLPIGSWAYRMNLMSALSVATSTVLLTMLALRYHVSMLVALAAALGFAFTLNTWMAGNHADPYTLTVLIGASLWWMAVNWAATGDRAWLWTLALVSGVGLGSAGVLSMELPAIIIYVICVQPAKFLKPTTMIVAGLLGIAGLVGIYLYLPIRASMNPPLNYGNAYTIKGLKFVALGGQVGGVISYLTWEGVRIFLRHLPRAFAWYGGWLSPAGRSIVACFALTGLLTLGVRELRFAVCVALGIIVPIYPPLTMPINDSTHYLLISNWLLFFLVAVGFETVVMSPIWKYSYNSFGQTLWLIVCAVLLLLPIALVQVNWSRADMHDYHDADILVQGVFGKLKPGAVVFCWWGPSAALWYGKYVEHLRPDVDIYDDSRVDDIGWKDATIGMAHFVGKRPVYSVPFGDQLLFYQHKFELQLVAEIPVFGQSLYEVTSLNRAASGPAGR